MALPTKFKWWQRVVFYQIYPRSFADGNGDGIGDIAGIIAKLDYLAGLGIEALWLSPHYPSPLFDCGYDVADYVEVAPEYGTLDDFRRLLDEAHRRGIRVIPSATGTSGGTAGTEGRPTTGSLPLAARPGNTTCTPTSTITTIFSPSSRTSTGATQRSSRPCLMRSASGWIWGWMAFDWMRLAPFTKTRPCRITTSV